MIVEILPNLDNEMDTHVMEVLAILNRHKQERISLIHHSQLSKNSEQIKNITSCWRKIQNHTTPSEYQHISQQTL